MSAGTVCSPAARGWRRNCGNAPPPSCARRITTANCASSPPSGNHSTRKNELAKFELRLYVAGQTAKSLTAFANLKRICETHLAGQYRIEVIDLTKTPALAAGDQIFAVPTLVRRLPEPIKKIIGDLSNEERVLVGLDVQPVVKTV